MRGVRSGCQMREDGAGAGGVTESSSERAGEGASGGGGVGRFIDGREDGRREGGRVVGREPANGGLVDPVSEGGDVRRDDRASGGEVFAELHGAGPACGGVVGARGEKERVGVPEVGRDGGVRPVPEDGHVLDTS